MSGVRVVITGLGFVTPIGNDRATVRRSLIELRHGLERVEWFPDCSVRVAGTIKEFALKSVNQAEWTWPARYEIPRETLRAMPPHGVYALCAIEQALAESGLSAAEIRDGATGLFCASAGSPRFLAHHMAMIRESGGQKIHPWSAVRSR